MVYEKYSVNGNTFIIFKDEQIKDDYSYLAERLCDVNTGIGADGLIVIQYDPFEMEETSFEWRYYNSDGSKVDFCGNGACAVAYYAYKHGFTFLPITDASNPYIVKRKFEYKNEKYLTNAIVDHLKKRVDISLPYSKIICEVPRIDGKKAYLVDTGVLHLVLVAESLPDYIEFDIKRFREIFNLWNKKVNINIVFEPTAEVIELYVKTFEKGVESITESCGSGIVACYLAMHKKKYRSEYEYRIVDYPKYRTEAIIEHNNNDNLLHLSNVVNYVGSITIEE